MDVRHGGTAELRGIGRSLTRACALGSLLVVAAWAQGGSAVESAWTGLEREFAAEWQAYQTALQQAQQQRVDPSKWPASPVDTYWERCASFADRGEVGAIRWCISYSEASSLAPPARNQRRHDSYRRWAKTLPEGPGLKEVIRSLQLEASPGRLGSASVGALLAEISARVQDRNLRGAARVQHGILLLGAGGPENVKRARNTIVLGIEDDPGGDLVPIAQGRLFQLDRLQIGMACPDFTAKDVEGVEFKRSDYLGKVVVLDFWGFW